ncbi:MAG: MmgE/PrpD family protein [Chloroflexota bacterium]
MADLMQTIVKYVVNTRYEDLTPEAVHFAKNSILDTIACAIAGSSADAIGEIVDLVKDWGGKPQSTIPLFGVKVPAISAALALGPMVRCRDLCDLLESPHGAQPSGYIFPAIVPAAEMKGKVSGKQFLTAMALAQDVIYRFVAARKGMAGKPWRPPASIFFGITAGVIKVLGMDEETAGNAMGLTLGEAVSEGQSIREGKLMIRMSHGTMAADCIRSALLAQIGITGPKEVLQGDCGYYHVHEPEHDLAPLTHNLGKVFYGPQTSVKIYPSCRGGHPIMDAALDIVTANDIRPGDVAAIDIVLSPYGYSLICKPEADKSFPKTHVDAQFSAAYMVALMVLKRTAWFEDFSEEAIKDPKIHRLLEITKTSADPAQAFPDNPWGGKVTVRTKSGKEFMKEVIHPVGHPKNPVSEETLLAKFRKCLPYAIKPLKESSAEQIIEMTRDLEKLDDVNRLFALLVP